MPTPGQELDAARIVSALTHLGWRRLEPGRSRVRLAGFELLDDLGQRAGLLEVTASAAGGGTPKDVDRSNTAHRWNEEAGGTRTWAFAAFEQCWTVWTGPEADEDGLRTTLPDELSRLESAGLVGELLDEENGRLPAHLAASGVIALAAWHRVEPGEEALVVVHSGAAGAGAGLAAVTQAAQQALDRLDNQERLYYSAPGIGELFVWLEDGASRAALGLGELPSFNDRIARLPPPLLPSGITGVWAAMRAASPSRPADAVWHSRGRRWRRVPPPTVAAGRVTERS